jgi:signal transduction histidine kinase
VSFPLATRVRITDRVLGPEPSGLAAALADALGDPRIAILRHVEPGSLRVDDDDGRPIAYVRHEGGALADPRVAASVASAVRLVLTRERLQHEQEDLVRRQAAARARLVAAADRQRERITAELRERVEERLLVARRAVAGLRDEPRHAAAADSLDIVAGELGAAVREIAALVAAAPRAELGDGKLVDALRSLAATSPIPVDVAVTTGASRAVETALYYVCNELLTNAVKHAGAGRVTITVRRLGDTILATVEDDGHGGADPAGSGLQGLGDRLAALGGRLSLRSPPGGGTRADVTVPG